MAEGGTTEAGVTDADQIAILKEFGQPAKVNDAHMGGAACGRHANEGRERQAPSLCTTSSN